MRKDNIRIAKNTIIVYVLLIITAILGLLTSRYVLQLLGASDYGLYSVFPTIGEIPCFSILKRNLFATVDRFSHRTPYSSGLPVVFYVIGTISMAGNSCRYHISRSLILRKGKDSFMHYSKSKK